MSWELAAKQNCMILFVEKLAKQKKTDEIEDGDGDDWEGAWDYIIDEARRLIGEL